MIKKVINWFENHNKISWIITFLIAITIFYMSSLQFEGYGKGFALKPLLYHLFAFFFFSLFLIISLLKGEVNGKTKPLLFLAIVIAITYGILDEVHQLFVPSRYFSIFDILTDSVGTLIASVIYLKSN